MRILHSLLIGGLLVGPSAFLAAGAKPNIVLIMADDVSWEVFSMYGGEDTHTPHLDRLSREGVLFEHCYATPLCTPSRVMMMTGQYSFRNYTDFGYLDRNSKTFAHLLKEAGYATAIAGKWQLNGLSNKSKHKDWGDNTRPFRAGFDTYALWQVTRSKRAKNGGGERFWSSPIEVDGRFIPAGENLGNYTPDTFSDFICDFIEEQKDGPFFVYYPTVLVHDPFVPTPDTIGKKSRAPEANAQPSDSEQVKEHFVSMVSYMDKIVGKIVDKLDSEGVLENTLILFTADNGTDREITSNWQGQKIPGGKGELTDMGTRVPLIAYWKGRAQSGVVIDDLVDFTDFYPTLADVAGTTLGETDPSDGQSFLPQILGEQADPREWVLNYYQPYWGRWTPGKFARNWKYKLYGDGRFFDISNDLFESEDLSETPLDRATASIYNKLKGVLESTPDVPVKFKEGRLVPGNKIKERPIFPKWEISE